MATLKTPVFTMFYPYLFQARLPTVRGQQPKPGAKAKYELTALFTPDAAASPEFKALQHAAIQKAIEKFVGPQKWDEATVRDMIRNRDIRMPFRMDVVAKKYPPEYKYFIKLKANEDAPPGIVDLYIDPKTGKAKVITDPRVIYSGVLARASVEPYAYGGPGTEYSPGISFGLLGVQRMGDGTRMDGRSTPIDAADDFGAEQLPEGALDDDGPSGSVTKGGASSASSKDDLNDLLG